VRKEKKNCKKYKNKEKKRENKFCQGSRKEKKDKEG
jgi:hypothetical protein